MIDLRKPQRLTIKKRGQLARIELPASPTAVYSPPAFRRTEIRAGQIMVVNRTNQARKLTIWYDDDGALTGNPELIHFEVDVPAKGKFVSEINVFMDNSAGTISMEAEAINALIVTIFGTEYIRA